MISYLIIAGIVSGLIWLLSQLHSHLVPPGMPSLGERVLIHSHLWRLQNEGKSLKAKIKYVQSHGLTRDAAIGLILDLEKELIPNTQMPHIGEWQNFKFAYPGNWECTTIYHDPGFRFHLVIQDRNNNNVSFQLVDSPKAYELLYQRVKKQLDHPQTFSITSWGAFKGHGHVLTGFHQKFNTQLQILIFIPEGVCPLFTIMETVHEEQWDIIRPGIQIIQETFECTTVQH